MPKDMMGTCYLNEHLQPTHEMMHVIGRNYFCHCLSKGAIGICLSHLSVLKDAYQSGYETIWVMEDDIEVKQDPHILSQLIDELDRLVGKNGWDILFTDPDTKASNGEAVICCSFAKRPNFTPENPEKFAIKTPISPNLRKIGARYGAYSMIVRRSGMKKPLNFFNKYHLFLPFDMDYTLPNDIRLYTVAYDIVSTQPKALSDNGAPNYKRHNKDVSYD
jgi:GR25 family glycosyltransferase involved in LPS biosynthesis